MARYKTGTLVRVTEDAIEYGDMSEYGVKVGDLGVVAGYDNMRRVTVHIFNDLDSANPWHLDDHHVEEVCDEA